MRKQQNENTIYKPNDRVKIKVVNKPVIDDDTGEIYMYEVSVTMTEVKYETSKPLRFKSGKELTEYIHNIDLTDYNENQTTLLPSDEEDS